MCFFFFFVIVQKFFFSKTPPVTFIVCLSQSVCCQVLRELLQEHRLMGES